jgi:signal transduction histidine kinase
LFDRQQHPQVRYASLATADRNQLIGKDCYLFEYYQATLREGNPVFVSNIDQSELPPDIIISAKEQGIRAFFMAPLLNEEEDVYWGHICLQQCDRLREWTGDDLMLMSTISNQCAIAIHQAKLFEKIQQQASQEQLLNEISRELNSQLEPSYILSQIVKQTGEYFQGDRVVIFSIKNQQVQVVHEWRSSEEISSLLGFQAPLSEWQEPLADLELQRDGFLANFSDNELAYGSSWEQQLYQGNILSLLRVPIYIRDKFFGAISIHSTTKNRVFEPDEIHLLERIADQTAIALYNAQSYERLEQLVKERTQELEREKILSEAANRTKTEFLNNMSHELRTPLTGILGFSNVLSQDFFGPMNEKQKQYLANITECGEQLLNLINDLLDISKIEANEENLEMQTLLVEEICGACLSLVQERAKNEGLELHTEIAPDARFCVGDSRRIKQIMFNLLSNAIKFTHAGSVTLKVWQNEDKIYFSVIDTGIGIPEAEQALIFEPFHQLDQGLSRKYEGTGLGLALSQKLAWMHGGDIILESEVNRGSCFTFWLPLNRDLMHTECPVQAWETINN